MKMRPSTEGVKTVNPHYDQPFFGRKRYSINSYREGLAPSDRKDLRLIHSFSV